MDCCPLMVSELPVVCSRIDGVVTVVKTEQPGSASYRHLYWGESSLVSNWSLTLKDPSLVRLGIICKASQEAVDRRTVFLEVIERDIPRAD